MQDRLIDLIHESDLSLDSVRLADHLIANGVIVLPCKVGDEVWYIDKNYSIQKAQISSAIIKSSSMHFMAMRYVEETEEIIKLALRFEALNVDYWLTKEEAEQALAKMKGGAE